MWLADIMGLPVTGLRVMAALAVTATMITGVSWACKPAPNATDPIPLPEFNAPATARAAPDPLRRDTLLPTSCADLFTGSPNITSLLGQPTDSLDAHPIVRSAQVVWRRGQSAHRTTGSTQRQSLRQRR
jgi:hypothetical protein